jgi:competence protein ComEC
VRERIAALVEAQRPRLALWIPVFYAFGIAGYFAAPSEPSGSMLAGLGAALALVAATLLRAGPMARLLLVALLLPGIGFGAAALRARAVAAPVLAGEITANLEGRVIGLDRSASERPRVLLDRVVIFGLEPGETPARVRVSLDPSTPWESLRPGMRLIGQARLSPPAAPAEPGGFDFRRLAWFEGLGAVGYARTPFLGTGWGDGRGFGQLTFRLRMALSAHVRAMIPGQNGAFAAAILSGDRSAISAEVNEDLRRSTLYHIVSIGGLHMSLIAAAVFAIVRYGLALVPRLALVLPLKKIAAVVSLGVTLAYLAVSGFDVAAQRAFVMLAVVLAAVVLDRPALTMRSVAVAAAVILVVAPESLTLAGFQMSFAGTIALIAAFEALRGRTWWQAVGTPRWQLARPVLAVFVTSLVAGAATAPYSAFHFNVLAQYGLFANLLAMPAMGLVVMPAAVVALVLAPLGLDWVAFTVMGWGVGYVLGVASWVAGLGGAVVGVPAGPAASLGLMTLGGLFFVLWIGRGRWAGLAPAAVGVALWAAADRPGVLIADNGRLFGIATPSGRILSAAEGNGFAAASWLEDDGDLAGQAEAHARGGLERRRHRIEAEVPGIGRLVYVGSREAGGAEAECAAAAVLIAPNWERAPDGECLFVGRERLARDGALAIRITGRGLVVEGARSSGRPWSDGPRGEAPVRVARSRTRATMDKRLE